MKTRRDLLSDELNKMRHNLSYLNEADELSAEPQSDETLDSDQELVDNNLGSDSFEADSGEDELSDPSIGEVDADGKVEVNISDLVNKMQGQDTKIDNVINTINTKFSELSTMFSQMNDDMDSKVQSVKDKVTHEIKQANPTPRHKLEMRSLDSSPFNVRLGDYWSKHLDNYDVESNNELVDGADLPSSPTSSNNYDDAPSDYTLTDVNIADTYDESNVMSSFHWMPY